MISKDHLHFMFIPAVPDTKHDGYDYKLCADQLTRKSKLKGLHPGLQQHLDNCGINATVFRKKDTDGKRIRVSINQIKEITASTGHVFDSGITVQELSNILKTNIEQTKDIEKLSNLLNEKCNEITQLKDKIDYLQNKEKTIDTWGTNNSWGISPSWSDDKTYDTEDKSW